MSKPIVIAHRGASAYLPEHTLEGAALAYALGADYIEQDLVLTKDGELIVLHDIHLDTTTDVEERYPERARSNGRFYALDFTLAEIRTLRVHEREDLDGNPVFPDRYRGHADFRVATFSEQIELVTNLNRMWEKEIGLYPEIKAPAWHREQGYDISQVTLDLLRLHSLDDADRNIYVQCFDWAEVQRLRNKMGLEAKLIQLIGDNAWDESTTDYEQLITPEGLQQVAKVAQGIGPWIPQVVEMHSGRPTDLVKNAHAAGLAVHPFTFRLETIGDRSAAQVLNVFFNDLGVDGVFTDHPDVVREYLSPKK